MKTTPILGLPYPELPDSADVPRDIKALAQKLDNGSAGGIYVVGELRQMLRRTIPTGWLLCDGRAVSRATYADLYAEIGGWVGAGDGSTTFNLPDVAGRALVAAGAGAGLTARNPGGKWGAEAVALAIAELPAHDHGGATAITSPPDHVHTAPFQPGWYTAAVPAQYAEMTLGAGTSLSVRATTVPLSGGVSGGQGSLNHGHGIPVQGGSAGHDNTPPSFAAPVYIYAGV